MRASSRYTPVLLSLALASSWIACSATDVEPTSVPDAGTADPYDASDVPTDAPRADGRTPREARPDEPEHWPTRRCDETLFDRDAEALVEHAEGGACFLERTCGTEQTIQPGHLCDSLDICFEQPYEDPLPGRFAGCRRYADAPECCASGAMLNDDPYHRSVVDQHALDDICALTALGAHLRCNIILH